MERITHGGIARFFFNIFSCEFAEPKHALSLVCVHEQFHLLSFSIEEWHEFFRNPFETRENNRETDSFVFGWWLEPI